jgi:hypothetical protein
MRAAFPGSRQLRAGCEVGKPTIETVVGRHGVPSERRVAEAAPCRSEFLLADSGFTQGHAQGHDAPIAVRARAGLLFVFCPAGPMWANG